MVYRIFLPTMEFLRDDKTQVILPNAGDEELEWAILAQRARTLTTPPPEEFIDVEYEITTDH